MNKKTIAIIVAVVAVLAIAGVAIALNMNKNTDDNSKSQTGNTNQTSNNVDPAKEFSPQGLDTLSYVATTTTTVNGQTVESTTESDGRGTVKSSSSFGGMTSESYVVGSTVTTCVNGECTKSTVDANSKETEALVKDASEYKDSAVHAGTDACPAGTCQVWTATGPAGEIKYYIDAQNRISKIAISASSSETTYDYKDVSITVPTVE